MWKLLVFTFLFATPNKLWVSDSITSASSTFLFIIGVIMGCLEPAIFMCLIFLGLLAIASLTFSVLYQTSESFRCSFNSILLDDVSAKSSGKILVYFTCFIMVLCFNCPYECELNSIHDLTNENLKTIIAERSLNGEHLNVDEISQVLEESRRDAIDKKGFLVKFFYL